MPSFALIAQYVLPQRLLSRVVMWATRVRLRAWKNMLIRRIIKRYQVNCAEAEWPDPEAYVHFNAFFTRALKTGARLADAQANTLLMPADGRISQVGRISAGRLLQAKGQHFTAAELLGHTEDAKPFAEGHFVTVYLSPRDYHRVHMPWTGRLRETVHIPGHLFSVAPFAVQSIPGLFARNERLVCHFETEFGPMAVVMVGAMLVSGIETRWGGVEIPPYGARVVRRDRRDLCLTLSRFEEMARFNMGSTVIALFPSEGIQLLDTLCSEQAVRVGERLGYVNACPP